MKPTLQQTEILKDYLNDILKYHETVDEIYDHVLTAIEEKPENVRFQDAVNQVLNNDFGGGKGLVEIEKQQVRNATWEAFTQVGHYIKTDFRFPNIFYTLILFAISYYAVKYIKINPSRSSFIFPLSSIIYLAIVWTRKFFVGYYTGDTRKSIQDLVATKIAYPSYWLLFMWMMFFPLKPKLYQFILTSHPGIFAGILTMYFLYVLAVVRICRNEFKPYIQT